MRGRGWRRARGSGERVADPQAGTAGGGGDGQGVEDEVREGEAGEPGDGGPPTPKTLRRAWMDEVAIVRRLKGQGLAGDHPAMQAACAARDSAEASWREAKEPVPAAVRLARAQARLDRAVEVQGEAHRALCDYEREHAERIAALRARLEEERGKVRIRREQLEAIQDEVGAEGRGARSRTRQGAAARQVHTALSNTVAPTIAALVEQLDSSTPAWGVLNGLLGTLADSQSVLERAFEPDPAAQRFNIAGGEEDGGDGAEGGDDHWDVESEWSESHELVDGVGTAPQGGKESSQWQTQGHDGGADDVPMDTEDWWGSPYPQWRGASRWQACGHGKWARSNWADAYEQERAEDSAEDDPPPAARRRLESAPTKGGASAGAAPPGETTEEDQRRRLHEGRIQRVVLAAIDAGIQPITPAGEDLQQLDARQLDEWIAVHFPAGADVQ